MRRVDAQCIMLAWALSSGVLDKTVVDICEAQAHIPGGHIGFIFFSMYNSHFIQSIGVSLPLPLVGFIVLGR